MYPTAPNNSKQKTIASLLAIFAVALIGLGIHTYNERQSPASITSTSQTASSLPPASSSYVSSQTPATSQPAASSSSSSSTGFKDGTYSSTSQYYVPSGSEGIKVTLTVQNGVITNSSVQNSETNPESARFQEDFAAEYKSYVVGKNLNSLYLSYVAGASDTTRGFDDALQQIQNQAKA